MDSHQNSKTDIQNLFKTGFDLCINDEKDKCIIGFQILEKIKNESPLQFLEHCKLREITKRLSFHVADLQLLKQLFIWRKSLTNETEDLTSINQYLNDLFKQKDLPYDLAIEGFSMITICNCLPDIKLVIETLVSLLQRIDNENIVINKEQISILNTIIRLVNIMSSKQYYNFIINKIIQIISTNHTSSSYLSLILPDYKLEKLNGIKLSIEEIMKCLFTLLSWPKSDIVSNWIDALISHFYFELMNIENKKQYTDLMIEIIEYYIPIICSHLSHGIEARGCLKTIENLMFMINSPRTFQKNLPILITTLLLYRKSTIVEKRKISYSIEDVFTFEEISKSKSFHRLYKPEKCRNLKSIGMDISQLIYLLIYYYSNSSDIYSNILGTLEPLYPFPNMQIIEERVKKLRTKHEIFRLSIKNYHLKRIETPQIISLKSDFMRENEVCGLINLGNTCYLNSYLQILYMTIPFRNYLFHSKGSLFIDNLRRTFARMILTDRSAISPLEILNHLPDYFKNGSQQDASEFGKILFDLLDESYKKISKDSPTSLFFEGKLSTSITCTTCNETSFKNETFIDLALSFPPERENLNLTDLIEYYLSTEILQGENQYFCEKCNCLCDAKRLTHLKKTPKHLLLTLSRFYFDVKSLKRHKILDHVSYPEILNLPIVDDYGNNTYEKYILYGVIMHAGRSAEYGHYYAFARKTSHIIDNYEDKWIKFNDEYVTPSTIDSFSKLSKLNSSEVVYILAYIKLDEKDIEIDFTIPDDLINEVKNKESK